MKKAVPFLGVFFFICAVGTYIALMKYTKDNKPMPIYGQAPSFVMTDARGQTFDTASLAGKVWVVDFFFTNCPGPCPTMTKNMGKLHKTFGEDLHLVNVSVDPANDTPEVMAKYGRKFKANLDQWHFLNGSEEEVRRVSMEGFKIGQEVIINHATKFGLVDRDGNIRGYYEGTNDEDMARLEKDIKRLL